MRKAIFYVSTILLSSCVATKELQNNDNKLISGDWYIQEPAQSFYYKLEFNHNEAVCYTTGDTILFYVYELKKREFLTLRDKNKIEVENAILLLNHDSLVFQNFLTEQVKHVYLRKN